MPITMSDELFTLQRRAAEIAVLLQQRIDAMRANDDKGVVPVIGDWSIPSLGGIEGRRRNRLIQAWSVSE